MKTLLGIDIGTSSVKSLLMREDGTAVGTAQQEYDLLKPQAVYAEQDMEILWQATCKTLQLLTRIYPEEISQLAGISYSGQMHGLVAIDKNGKLIRNAIIWADQRSKEEIRELYQQIPEAEYHSVSLNRASVGFLISSLLWMKKHEPENYEQIARVMLPKDYIRYQMTGELGTDVSDASATGIFDTGKRQWAWNLIGRLGLRADIFVPCYEADEIAGEITGVCAKETGLPQGTKVTFGGGDSFMQAIGNGAIEMGILTANIGTACQLSGALNRPLFDKQFRTNTFCHALKDQWFLMGANLSGGVAMQWLKNQILECSDYEELFRSAASSPAGSHGLLFLPYLNGERTPWNDPNARAIYFGLNLKHQRADLIRATMEGIVFGQKASLEIFYEIGFASQKIIVSGGGTKNRLMRQIMADMFNQEVYLSCVSEQACAGAVMTAGVGTGVYASYEEVCEKMVQFQPEIIEPDPEAVKIYSEQFQIFKELYPANEELFQKGVSRGGM